MTAICPIHSVEMIEKEGQFGAYYSHTIPDQGYCNGKKITPFKSPQASGTPARPPAQSAYAQAKQDLTGEDTWSDKLKSEQITRLTIAKTFIQGAVDFDNAVKNADLKKWYDWVLTGKITTMKDEVDEVLEGGDEE